MQKRKSERGIGLERFMGRWNCIGEGFAKKRRRNKGSDKGYHIKTKIKFGSALLDNNKNALNIVQYCRYIYRNCNDVQK